MSSTEAQKADALAASNDPNSMLVEMMAAIARKDYEQRRERQAQGIEKAKAEGKYRVVL